jgi:quercetin dioxygenase-like cupin family protein
MAVEITTPGTDSGSPVTVDYLTDDSFGSSGKRAYFKYRDLRMCESSAGLVQGQEVRAIQSVDNTNDASTRWHYHTYRAQFIYVLEGWADLALPGGVIKRVTAGAFVSIAGGEIHNEIAISADFRLRLRCPQAVLTLYRLITRTPSRHMRDSRATCGRTETRWRPSR